MRIRRLTTAASRPEVVLFSDKICNDEETVRLHSHIHGMQKILEEKEGVGRKMDFMAQERTAKPIQSCPNPVTLKFQILQSI